MRILLGIALPAIALLLAFSAIVFLRVRADRLRDFDEGLEVRAMALGALIERDHGVWEADFDADSEVVEGLAGWEIRLEPDGTVLQSAPPPPGVPVRTWSKVITVASDDAPDEEASPDEEAGPDEEADEDTAPALPPARVRVTVVQDLRPLAADLRSLLGVLVAVGAPLAALALFLGSLISRRIVDPLERMARRAEAVVEPSPDPPLPLAGTGDEIDRLASTLNRTFLRLYEVWARQARFTADASHELRTPLAVIRTSAEVALRKERTADDYREALGTVLDGAGRMHETLEGLLLLARADAGAEPVLHPVDVSDIAREAVAAGKRLPGAARLSLVLDAPEPRSVLGDARQLAILFDNLLSNAVRHTPAGGTVTVRVSGDRDRVVLEVRDTGEGIPAEALDHVFDRFFRADEARSRDRGGVGLGLSIVKAIAAAHGGSVSAESRPGEGTTMIVTLPTA